MTSAPVLHRPVPLLLGVTQVCRFGSSLSVLFVSSYYSLVLLFPNSRSLLLDFLTWVLGRSLSSPPSSRPCPCPRCCPFPFRIVNPGIG